MAATSVGGVALLDAGQTSLAVGALVPEQDVVAVVGVGDAGEAVQGVVLAAGGLALGVGRGQFVAGGVEGGWPPLSGEFSWLVLPRPSMV
jgi:hypothetical protein